MRSLQGFGAPCLLIIRSMTCLDRENPSNYCDIHISIINTMAPYSFPLHLALQFPLKLCSLHITLVPISFSALNTYIQVPVPIYHGHPRRLEPHHRSAPCTLHAYAATHSPRSEIFLSTMSTPHLRIFNNGVVLFSSGLFLLRH